MAFGSAMAEANVADAADVERHREAITAAFHKFDLNGDGKISQAELKAVLQILDPSFSPDDLDSIFADADLSKDGVMSMDEFAAWAVAPLGLFGTVPANAASAICDEDRAAMKIQAVARGRAARKKVAVKKEIRRSELGLVKPMTVGELWDGLALRHGTIRKRVDVVDIVSGFKFCKRTGLTVELASMTSQPSKEPEDLSPEEVSHLSLVIQGRQTDVDDDEARKQIALIKDEARKSDYFGPVHESMKGKHFKNLVKLISSLMQLDQELLLEHWYWAEFGLFLPCVPILELLLTTVVYSKARLAALVSKKEIGDKPGAGLVNHPFHIKDLMLLAYNGGLIGVPDRICMTSEEVQAVWPALLRSTAELTFRHLTIRKTVAAGKIYQEPSKADRRFSKDPEGKNFLVGPMEISMLIEMLHANEKMKTRFTSPLEMMTCMVQHARVHGRLWDEDQPPSGAASGGDEPVVAAAAKAATDAG